MDETHAKKVKEVHTHNLLVEQELNNHPGYQAYLAKQSYEVNRTRIDESLKIPSAVYSNLSRDSKIAISNFTEDDRRTLVSAMTSESGFKHNRNTYAASTTQSLKEHDLVQDDDLSRDFDTLAKSVEALKNKLQRSSSSTPSIDNKQKPLKSAQFTTGHPTSIMADNVPSNRNAYHVENDYQIL